MENGHVETPGTKKADHPIWNENENGWNSIELDVNEVHKSENGLDGLKMHGMGIEA
jgi:hypothetical protein